MSNNFSNENNDDDDDFFDVSIPVKKNINSENEAKQTPAKIIINPIARKEKTNDLHKYDYNYSIQLLNSGEDGLIESYLTENSESQINLPDPSDNFNFGLNGDEWVKLINKCIFMNYEKYLINLAKQEKLSQTSNISSNLKEESKGPNLSNFNPEINNMNMGMGNQTFNPNFNSMNMNMMNSMKMGQNPMMNINYFQMMNNARNAYPSMNNMNNSMNPNYKK